jgi:hypothetical protein
MINYQFNAFSISSVLKTILADRSYQGKVTGVYKRAVNISLGDFLITAIDLNQKNLPYGILCDFSKIDLQKVLSSGDAVEVDSERLLIRDRMFEISYRTASVWKPEFYLQIQAGDVPTIQKNIDQLLQLVIQENNMDGLVPLFSYIPNILNSKQSLIDGSSTLVKKAYEALRSMINAIRIFDEGLIHKEFKQLTGLGIGLTPSGDDILAGLFATLIIISKAAHKKWFLKTLGNILPKIEGLTNDVSLNYHRAISQGYFPERFSSLIAAIVKAKSFSDLEPALQDMLQWGQTSGNEIILGMVIGFSLAVERINPKPVLSH